MVLFSIRLSTVDFGGVWELSLLSLRTEADGARSFASSNIYQVLRQHCAVYKMDPMSPAQKREVWFQCI